jgi:hypothetical protein
MKLVLPAEGVPGVALRVGPFEPLPLDLEAWRHDVLLRGLGGEALRVIAAVDRTTADGWKVNLVVTEVGATRRLHAFYRFVVHGCVAVAEADAHAFDAAMDRVKELFLKGRPDFAADRPVCARDVWAGFEPSSSS